MRMGIDIGGTFTDFVLFDEATGEFSTFKVLSTPHAPEEAVLAGLDQLLIGQQPEEKLNRPRKKPAHNSISKPRPLAPNRQSHLPNLKPPVPSLQSPISTLYTAPLWRRTRCWNAKALLRP